MRICCICFLLISFTGFTQPLVQSNLPIFVITTEGSIVNEPKVRGVLGVIDNPDQENRITDPFNGYYGFIGIEYRGASSQGFPKKPYGFELWDSFSNPTNATLLGLPPENDWVLIATYNDKSLVRDALAYHLGSNIMEYGPRTRMIELVVNGSYEGVYMLTEKVKQDKNRVPISKLSPSDKSGDELTGGYLLKIDKFDGNSGEGFTSRFKPINRSDNQEIYFQFHDPDYTEVTEIQRNYIKDFISRFESALNSTSYNNPVEGYEKYIDVESFIDFLLINEMAKNVDGYRLSTFMYKDRDSKGGKLKMGPVWDFNLAFGNADYCFGGPTEGWMYNFNEICGQDYWLIPFWWNRLLTDRNFRYRIRARWTELKYTHLSKESMFNTIDSIANLLNQGPQQRNFNRWPVMGNYVWPNYFVGQSYQEEVEFLKDWISLRWDWINVQLPEVSTSIANPEATRMEVYPNPLERSSGLTLDLPGSGNVSLQWLTATGQVFKTGEVERNSTKLYLSADELPGQPGLFLIRMVTSDQVFYAKVYIK